MKRLGALTLALAIGLAIVATGTVRADQMGRSGTPGDPTSEMMRGSMSEMMRGMPMASGSDLLGRERPLLSLALRHRAELGFSEDQAKTLEGLVDRFRKAAEQRIGGIENAERDLAALLKQEPTDRAKVESKVREIEAVRANLRISRITTIAAGRAALTPEQRQKLEALLATQPKPRRGDAGQGTPEGASTRGAEEMHRFMNSERAPQAMAAMMDMARRMGDGDTMLGMVRMMEMMGAMGGDGGGMMGGSPHQQATPEKTP